jgi:tetratricopeptide (TPR) repeat protein
MAFCTSCGAKLAENAKFCGACGAKIAPEDTAADNTAKADKLYDQASACYSDKNYEKAIDYLSQAISLAPDTLRYYRSRAFTYHAAKEYEKALADELRCIELSPDDSGLSDLYQGAATLYEALNDGKNAAQKYAEAARLFNRAKNYDKALENINRAIELDSTDMLTHCERGILHEKLNDYPKAVADFKKALTFSPGSQEIIKLFDEPKAAAAPQKAAEEWRTQGETFTQQRDFADAVRCFTEAIDLDPQNPLYYKLRGTAYYHWGEYDKAVADQTEAIRLDPDNGAYYTNRGSAYEGLDENIKAMADYDKSLELGETVARYYNRGLLHKKLEHFPKAVVDLEKALELSPGNQMIIGKLNELKSAGYFGDDSENDSDAEPYFDQGNEHIRNQEPEEAIAAFTEAINIDDEYPQVWTRRGFAYLLDDRYDEALADLDNAIALDDEDGDAYAYRADIHWRCGRKDNALEDLQRAFDLGAPGYMATADSMYNDGADLPEEIIDALREDGYIESEEEEDEEEE